jgi:L-iditol 2-dehydrogenase
MRALKLHEPGNLRLENISEPTIGPEEVLVQVMAVGVCGSDIPRILSYGAYQPGLTMGHEFSGVISKIGERVEKWAVGQRVTAAPLIPCFHCESCRDGRFSLCADYDYLGSRSDGAMAEYVRVPANNLIKLPDNVSFEAGAMTDPAANAMHALIRAKIQGGEKLAIFGIGPIGLFAIQIAQHLGAASIIAIDIREEKLKLGKEAGATSVIESSSTEVIKTIEELTEGQMVDIALDISGAQSAQHQCVMSAGNSGLVILVGISHDKLTLSEKAVDRILRRELTVCGSWNSFSVPFPGQEWSSSLELMAKGILWNRSFISHRLSLTEGPDIFREIQNGDIFFSKIMFYPQEK